MGQLDYGWFSLRAVLRHLIGRHTWIPLEVWDRDRGTITLEGVACWRCDERRAEP